MAVNGLVGAEYLLTRIGNSYNDEDCVKAVVVNVIRNCAGGNPSYRTAGCTELWNSFTKYKPGNKYHHIVERMTLSEAKEKGLLIGDLPVIYNNKTGTCDHIAYYMGGIGDYECIHSSKSKGCVCGTTLKNGFTHILRHRDINGVRPGSTGDGILSTMKNEEYKEMDKVLYTAKVSTGGGALNLRSAASTASSVIIEIPYGSTVSVTQDVGADWAMVCYNNNIGYVARRYLTKIEDTAQDADDNEEPISTNAKNGTWGVFVPCSNKLMANAIVGYFANGEVVKVSLGD